MYHGLTLDEWGSEESKDEHRTFMKSVHQWLALQATVDSMADLGTEYT